MRLKRACGQAYVVTVLFLTVLLGMSAAVLDVGSWYRAQRALQATVDAAALAGAQALPEEPGTAESLAYAYGDKNGGGVAEVEITGPSDTIEVFGERPVDGFFAKIFGVDSVTVRATAKAKSAGIDAAKYVAPIVVNIKHEKLQCAPPPCSGPAHATVLELVNLHKPGAKDAAGSFGLIDLREDGGGNPGASEMAGWMKNGFDQYMATGFYDATPSTNFNNDNFKEALDLRLNTEVLFPIYETIVGPGTNAKYKVIGWVGFVPTKFQATGDGGKVWGYFTTVTWEGIEAASGSSGAGLGVKTISLID